MENYLQFPISSSYSSPPSSSLSLNTTTTTNNNNSDIFVMGNNNIIDQSGYNNSGNVFLGLMSEMDQKVLDNSSNSTRVSDQTGLEIDQSKLGINNKKNKGQKKAKKPKYAFQTRSQVDILDDGYRWRKYGQKAVKNNKFPRSYYRCTYQGCNVKKQVQRLTKDEGVVVTTYEGVHSHSIEKSTDNFEHILTQMQIYSSF